MPYVILKSSLDGISGGASRYDNIEEVLREISYSKGWPSTKDLHAAIRKWANHGPAPGSVFCTAVTAIVKTASDRSYRKDDICHHCDHEGLDYGDLDAVEDGDIQQEVSCPHCSRSWVDVFGLNEQRELS